MKKYYSKLKQFVIFKGSDADRNRDYKADKWYFEPKESKETNDVFSEEYHSLTAALHAADDWEIEFA